jgi:hypothetical protein
MGEVILSNGKIVKINIEDITVDEWDQFVDKDGSVPFERALVSRCTGLTIEEIKKLKLHTEYAPIIRAMGIAMREPLADPNSQSASTEQD